jgi:hypothetical protein
MESDYELLENIDYDTISKSMEYQIEKSKLFLQNSLNHN